MARPPSITDEEILEAAREVFMSQGVNASTADIARKAGISEGTIFRRFATKRELFVAAMGFPGTPAWFATVDAIQGQGDLQENLLQLGDELIEFFAEIVPKMSMLVSNGDPLRDIHFHGVHDPHTESPPVRGLRKLRQFFLQEQRLGRMRPFDPEIAARMFVGAFHHWAFAEFAGLNQFIPMPRQSYIRGVVDILLRGTNPLPPTGY